MSFRLRLHRPRVLLLTLAWGSVALESSDAFTYVAAGQSQLPDTVVHPAGYQGNGKTLKISVGLHPMSKDLEDKFEFSAELAVRLWNHLIHAPENLSDSSEVPAEGSADVLGVLVHEMGHTLGLAHPSLGPLPGVPRNGMAYTKSMPGPNGEYEFDPGADRVAATADDVRGDDVNLNYFKVADNNPFTLPENGVFDSTTYSRDLERLPEGSLYSASASRRVAQRVFGIERAEGMMITGGSLVPGQVRRGLNADDIAGIRYAMSGIDETQGTSDDYNIELKYVGVDAGAEITVRFMESNGAAAASVPTQPLSDNHRVMAPRCFITYNSGFARQWVFPVPEALEVEPQRLNAKAVGYLIPTQAGERYAIEWPQERDDQPALMQFDGAVKTPLTGGCHMWIAEGEMTDIKLAFQEELPDLEDIQISHIRGMTVED